MKTLWRLALFAVLSVMPVWADSGFLPSNPVTAPTVAAPVLSPMPTIQGPVVTAPTLSDAPLSTATAATGTAAASAAKTYSTTSTTTKGTPAAAAKTPSTSALSLLGLGSDSPLLKVLSGSDGDSDSVDALSGILGNSSSSTDSSTLARVMSLLEKKEASAGTAAKSAAPGTSSTASAATGQGTTPPAAAAAKTSILSGGELVRFTVNGNDVTSGITTLVSSVLARDGSFLITGDRRYLSSNKILFETFYLMCRKNGDGTYRLRADVSQGTANAYSFLYRLSRVPALRGTITGDLLVFRTTDPDFRLDLVIRVISPSVTEGSGR